MATNPATVQNPLLFFIVFRCFRRVFKTQKPKTKKKPKTKNQKKPKTKKNQKPKIWKPSV
jgi:hypothetical protein